MTEKRSCRQCKERVAVGANHVCNGGQEVRWCDGDFLPNATFAIVADSATLALAVANGEAGVFAGD